MFKNPAREFTFKHELIHRKFRELYGKHETEKSTKSPYYRGSDLANKLIIFDSLNYTVDQVINAIREVNGLYSIWIRGPHNVFCGTKRITAFQKSKCDTMDGFYLSYYSTECNWITAVIKYLSFT